MKRLRRILKREFQQFTRTKKRKFVSIRGIRVKKFRNASFSMVVVAVRRGVLSVCVKNFVLNIIYEDDELLAVNKPAGLVCHPTKNGERSSLIGRARLYLSPTLNSQPSTGAAAPRLVNRLDRETSGVVVIAKNSGVAGELGKILESRAVQKEYLAIVHGHVAAEQGIIDAPLGRDERGIVAIKDCVRPDGAPSQTEFWMERRFGRGEGKFSLLRILPRTGRKHQIRIHLAHLGHPIVGDKLYGGDEDMYMALVQNRLTEAQREKLIFENHALHARSTKFLWRGKPVEFFCEPEKWFTDFSITTDEH
jgi:23S rRNA pseudouridine1911/1915/1917 synthase